MKQGTVVTRGLVVAGMGGGTGKSVVAVGLAAALVRQGHSVAPFKKGPDYIDAGWLALAAGRSCYNLDPFLMPPEAMLSSFARHADGAEVALVEGNRGLYDGVDVEGRCSTAELAKLLNLPVLLVVDCTKTTRTVAALVLGCRELDREVRIAGVVLNRIGTGRHEALVREAVERYAGIPVVGAIPRSPHDVFPQRHLGVTPTPEHGAADAAIAALAERTAQYLDLAKIRTLMAGVAPVAALVDATPAPADAPVRIGYLKDAAFQFYYAENLEALAEAGAELVPVNALTAVSLPADLDGLYIGGGFPETSAKELAANSQFRAAIKTAAEAGLPIYAECGGLIYLGEHITLDGVDYPLVGVFPIRFSLQRKPQAHGYTVLAAEADNPFYARGEIIRGHEFRYSRVEYYGGEPSRLAFRMERGVGFMDGRDGLVYKNVLALYTHIHATGTPQWALALVARAREYRQGVQGK
ncbi:MAG: cobyrinate a,c-diamide synthase [Thermodesulfobacteriota bacterium]